MNKIINNIVKGSLQVIDFTIFSINTIGGALLDSIVENENNRVSNKSDLERDWDKRLAYCTDYEIEQLLKENNIYNFSIKYDGRSLCERAIKKYMINNNRKAFY